MVPGMRILSRKTLEPQVAQQEDSRLFQLPLELREEIWKYALAIPPRHAFVNTHWHVYDKGYDNCTYEPQDRIPCRDQLWTRIGLLLTCRAAYNEAVQSLYDDVHFELVLFGGHARPDYLNGYGTTPSTFNNLKGRGNLGSLAKCGPLKRIRHATIVVQPGRHPSVSGYRSRVADLLSALEFGQHLKCLRLKLNFCFGNTMTTTKYDRIIGAFTPLAAMADDPRKHIRLMPYAGRPTGPEHEQAVAELQAALKIESSAVVAWTRTKDVDKCTLRGGYGDFDPVLLQRAMTQKELKKLRRDLIVARTLVVATLPVSVPVLLGFYVRRKVAKGETWRTLSGR